jgi:hypothetical protein
MILSGDVRRADPGGEVTWQFLEPAWPVRFDLLANVLSLSTRERRLSGKTWFQQRRNRDRASGCLQKRATIHTHLRGSGSLNGFDS